MRYFITMVLFVILLHCNAVADTVPPSYTYLNLGTGLTKTAAFDQVNSCLPYSGFGFGLNTTLTKQKLKYRLSLGNFFSVGFMLPVEITGYDNSVNYYHNNTQVEYLRRLMTNTQQDLYVYAGGRVKTQFGFRTTGANVYNNSFAYDMSFTLMPVLYVEKYFSLHSLCKRFNESRNFSVQVNISYPLYAAYVLPPYNGLPDNALRTDGSMIDFGNVHHSLLGAFINPEINSSLIWHMKNGNALALQYQFNYYYSRHTFITSKTLYAWVGVSLMVNLKKS